MATITGTATCAAIPCCHIGRRNFEYEHISREFDYSPDYIDALAEQGYTTACEAISQYQNRSGDGIVCETFLPAPGLARNGAPSAYS